MQNDHLIARMQSQLLAFESLFFEIREKALSLSRLHTESSDYDANYENAVRRHEMALAVLLDEILYVRQLSTLETAGLIYELEKILFSPDFYRDLIFGRPLSDFEPQFTALCENINTNIEILSHIVTDSAYLDLISTFPHQRPPATRAEFLAELGRVQEFLGSKKDMFAQK